MEEEINDTVEGLVEVEEETYSENAKEASED